MAKRIPKKMRKRMNGNDLKSLRQRLGLTPTEAAASVSVSARTWQRWEASDKPIPEPMEKLFKLVHKIEVP